MWFAQDIIPSSTLINNASLIKTKEVHGSSEETFPRSSTYSIGCSKTSNFGPITHTDLFSADQTIFLLLLNLLQSSQKLIRRDHLYAAMASKLIRDGKIQILGQTVNSVVYVVGSDSHTGLAKDSPSVLKGGSVWYEGKEALGPGKDIAESDKYIRKEASIYQTLGQHDHILSYISLETGALDGPGSKPKAWALRLERSHIGSLRDKIVNTSTNPPSRSVRLRLAYQFSKGVAHLHQNKIIWGDLSTRNALLFDEWHVKLGDFADSDGVDAYPRDWYGCEDRYCPPGSDNPQRHNIETMKRELFALGSAIYEVLEWTVPYGFSTEISDDMVREALSNGKWPELSDDNHAKSIIQKLWRYSYQSSREVVHDLQGLLPSCR